MPNSHKIPPSIASQSTQFPTLTLTHSLTLSSLTITPYSSNNQKQQWQLWSKERSPLRAKKTSLSPNLVA